MYVTRSKNRSCTTLTSTWNRPERWTTWRAIAKSTTVSLRSATHTRALVDEESKTQYHFSYTVYWWRVSWSFAFGRTWLRCQSVENWLVQGLHIKHRPCCSDDIEVSRIVQKLVLKQTTWRIADVYCHYYSDYYIQWRNEDFVTGGGYVHAKANEVYSPQKFLCYGVTYI